MAKDTDNGAFRIDAKLAAQMTPEVIDAAIRLIAERNSGKLQYPTNAHGVPEYRSVVLRLDHLFFDRAKVGLSIQKMVMSCEEPYDAIMALMAYYADDLNHVTFKTLLEWKNNCLTDVLVYFAPKNERDIAGGPIFEVVIGMDLHNRISRDKDKGKFSYLATRDVILDAIDKVIARAAATKQSLPGLISVSIYDDAEEEIHPAV